MGEQIRRMDAKKVEKILAQYGYELISQKGSHRKWRNLSKILKLLFPIIKVKTFQWEHLGIYS